MKCISRDAFIAWLKRIPIRDLSDGLGLCRIIMVDDFERAIKELPSDIIYDVEPKPSTKKNTCFRGEKEKHSLLVFRKESRYART